MFARLLLESFRRGRRAKLLALGAVALGTLAATALGVLVLDSGDRFARALATYGANVRVVPAAGDTLPAAELAKLDESFWRNNLVAIAPLYEIRVRYRSEANRPASAPTFASSPAEAPTGVVAPVVGTWFGHRLGHWQATGLPATRPSLPVTGRWPAEGGPPEIALGRRLAGRLGVTVGERVRLELGAASRAATVVGVVGGGGEEEDSGVAPLGLVQALAGHPGRITSAELFALTVPEPAFQRKDPKAMSPAEYDAWYCTAYPSAVARSVSETLPSGRAEVVRQAAGAAGAVLLKLRVVLLALGGIALLGAFLGVASTMTATVQGRMKELALLAALGSERRWIVRFFLTEASLIGVAGGLAGGLGGLVAGRLLARGLFDLGTAWNPALLPFAVLLGLAVAVAGTLKPLSGVLRNPPALILGGGMGGRRGGLGRSRA